MMLKLTIRGATMSVGMVSSFRRSVLEPAHGRVGSGLRLRRPPGGPPGAARTRVGHEVLDTLTKSTPDTPHTRTTYQYGKEYRTY